MCAYIYCRFSRERVLTAEGEKKAYTLQSEGVKIQLINESEGHLIQVQNQARANKDKIRLEAEVCDWIMTK